MCRLIAHRGPDGEGVWTDGPIGLGHRRLAVIDPSTAGRQPMATADGDTVVTFNGEIYNFLDLRRELEGRGHEFRSRTDTEVILAAYRQWGFDCLARFRGMFAFALWDAKERVLFVARDRVGKKPLCYFNDREGIAFASEPKAFIADPSFQAKPNLEAISAYLSHQYVPSPLSAFEGVQKLPPAHFLVVRDRRITIERYWRLSYSSKRALREEEASADLLQRLREAVRLRLVSDVPLGAFLSGGVDSSAVVALMAEACGTVKTFSIGFAEKEFDELPYARLVAKRYATDHHEFVVRPRATDILPELVWHYNEPFADASAIPTYYLSELARRHVTVALNGDAGDENFAGYRRYVSASAAQRFDRLPATVRHTMRRLIRHVPAPKGSASIWHRGVRLARRISDSHADRYARRMMIFDQDLMADVCEPQFLRDSGNMPASRLLVDAFNASDASSLVETLMDIDVQFYLPDCLLVKVDIATMAHGLEGRSPMLDHEFMEFAASLPSHLKLRGRETKYILKRAVSPLLPAEIIDRPKKGFSVPLDEWFRNDLRDMAGDLLLDGHFANRGYFRARAVERMLHEHWSGVTSWHNQLWTLLMLECWHRRFIDEHATLASTAFAPPAHQTV
jgi:asparagine synthase (glutamine-hydrolysing)